MALVGVAQFIVVVSVAAVVVRHIWPRKFMSSRLLFGPLRENMRKSSCENAAHFSPLVPCSPSIFRMPNGC